MKKINWEMVGALAGVVALVITIALAWDDLVSLMSWQILLALLAAAGLIAALVILASKRQIITKALKPKPRLVVIVRDINIYVSQRQETTLRLATGTSEKRISTKGKVSLTIKVENRGRSKATNVLSTIEFTLGKGDSAYSARTKSKKSLTRRQILPLLISFDSLEISPETSGLYPNGPYVLVYTYTCDERPKERKVVVEGELAKVDWVGDLEALRTVKEGGFYHYRAS